MGVTSISLRPYIMKKLYLFSLLLSIAALISISVWISTPQEANDVGSKNISAVNSQKHLLKEHISNNQLLAFNYMITTEMSNGKKELLAESSFQGKIALKKQLDSGNWQGQIVNSSLKQLGEQQKFSPAILFQTQYKNFVFKETDLLGLTAEHPVNAIKYLLKQLSYQLDNPLVIEDANSTSRYQYQSNDLKISRQLQSRREKHTDLPINVANFTEQWLLELNKDRFPKYLTAELITSYQNQGEDILVKQTVQMTAINESFSWSQLKFASDCNAELSFERAEVNSNISINSSAELNAALLKLVSLPDEALAQAIGKYLIENASVDDIVMLINQQDSSSKLASLIIYSIQKNANFAAEVVLVSLLSHQELLIDNKQRIVMSLGRFEAVSDLSLNQLKKLSQEPTNELANTAALSIGTVARYNQEQQYKVNDFLSEQLTKGENTSVTLLAISNSGLTELNDQAAELLGDQSANVNVALIKLLAKDPTYHNKLIDFAINSDQAKSINELARALASRKVTLTEKQKILIVARIDNSANKVIKDQLNSLLTLGDKLW